jgi:hypothetical protein
MATVIRFTADGISDEMVVPSVSFNLNSSADVTNPTQEIDFQPIGVSEFNFSILSPTAETSQKLIEWIANHEVKSEAKFSINKQALTEAPREIVLKDVCLTGYSEDIDVDKISTSLTVVARKVTLGDIEIDVSRNR